MSAANYAAGVKKVRKLRVAHNLVVETAREIAQAYYEEAARDNGFYRDFPDAAEFVDRSWNAFSNAARESLVSMLAMDDYSEHTKATIYDALLKDGAFNHRGQTVQ